MRWSFHHLRSQPRCKIGLSVLTLVLSLLIAPSAFAERRVALVIGNSEYEHANALKNPRNDTEAVSKMFTLLGYDVHLKLDVDRQEMTSAISQFSQISQGADVAIFYYAGHGISVDGRNYLVPIDGDIRNAAEVKLGAAVDAELAIDQALSDANVKLVFLDACRDNPFVDQIKRSLKATRSNSITSGLSEMKSGSGTLIAFSTAPGQVALDGEGERSPFAEALLTHLSEPGLEVRLAMTKVRAEVEAKTGGRQIPWESTNLTGFYYFRDAPAKPEVQNEDVPAAHSLEITSDAEIEYWRSVKDSNSIAMLEAYMMKFPNGLYSSIAELLIDQLKSKKLTSLSNDNQTEKSNTKEESGQDKLGSSATVGDAVSTMTASKAIVPTPPIESAIAKEKVVKERKSSRDAAKVITKSPASKQKPKANDNASVKPIKNIASLKQPDVQPSKLSFVTRKAKNGKPYRVPNGSSVKEIAWNVILITYRGMSYQCNLNQMQPSTCRPPQ